MTSDHRAADGSRPFHDASTAISWGATMLRGVVARDLDTDEPASVESLAHRESRWLLEAAAVSAGRDPLFVRRTDLTTRVAAVFRSHIARRARGEPLAYVVSEASFRGIDLFVTPDVLIPRPETEQLVELALSAIPPARPFEILDQGTGSGAVAIALAVERPLCRVTAVDVSVSALDLARRNVARHGLSERVRVEAGDLFPASSSGEPQPAEPLFDMLVANLPYLPDDARLPPVVAEWEPRGALRAGRTGKELIERSIREAPAWVKPGGILLYEIGEDQKYSGEFTYKMDLAGKIRFIMAKQRG